MRATARDSACVCISNYTMQIELDFDLSVYPEVFSIVTYAQNENKEKNHTEDDSTSCHKVEHIKYPLH